MAEIIPDSVFSNPLDVVRFVNHNVSSKEEDNYAEEVASHLRELLSSKNVDANLSISRGQIGSVTHPLIKIWNIDYGTIGILVNKNILTVMQLKYGKTSSAIQEIERLRRQADGSDNVARRRMAESDSGCCGCLGYFMDSNDAKKKRKEADNISYDPAELASEEYWKRDVLSCIDSLGRGI